MWEIGTKYRKKSGLTLDEIERNERRLAKINAAEEAAARQARKEKRMAAHTREELPPAERSPPSYNLLVPTMKPSSRRPSSSSDRTDGSSPRMYFSRPRARSSAAAAIEDDYEASESYYGGLAALWRPDIAYHEARDRIRGMGESGPGRILPPDHPVYDMDPKERARLERIGIDPVAAAELKRISSRGEYID